MSKVRVYLKNGPNIYTNRVAYAFADTNFEVHGVAVPFPKDFKKWPKWKRTQWKVGNTQLADYYFKVFREPRNTPARRSLFYSEVVRLGGGLPPKLQKARLRNGNQIAFIDEANANVANVWQINQPRLRVPVRARQRIFQVPGR